MRVIHGYEVHSGGLGRLFLTRPEAERERRRVALLRSGGEPGAFRRAFYALRVEPATWVA